MTAFERLTLIVSIAAILISVLIPLCQFIYHRYLKRLKIDIIPFDRLEIIFNESGPYFKMKFALQCKNQDTTVTAIKSSITRKTNNETLNFEWSFFDPVQLNWIGGNMANSLNSTAYARPIKISKDSLEPLIIEFSCSNNAMKSSLVSLCEKRDNSIQEECAKAVNAEKKLQINDIISKIKQKDVYINFISKLTEYFFWKPDDYVLTLHILYDKNKETSFSYQFSLTDDDSELLKGNIEKTIFCRFLLNNNLSPNFNRIYKLFGSEIKKVQ